VAVSLYLENSQVIRWNLIRMEPILRKFLNDYDEPNERVSLYLEIL